MHMSSLIKTKIIKIGKTQLLTCPVCEFVLRNTDDVKSAKSEGACIECTINFKHLHIDQWELGWRPTVKEARSKITYI
jgi:hypothetical protein